MAKTTRDGHGHRAYRRKREALRRRTKTEQLTCGHGSDYGCGHPIDTTLPAGHRLSFTADHPAPLKHGGHLLTQDLIPMHRRCNAIKGDHVTPVLRDAT